MFSIHCAALASMLLSLKRGSWRGEMEGKLFHRHTVNADLQLNACHIMWWRRGRLLVKHGASWFEWRSGWRAALECVYVCEEDGAVYAHVSVCTGAENWSLTIHTRRRVQKHTLTCLRTYSTIISSCLGSSHCLLNMFLQSAAARTQSSDRIP